eukprot:3114-Heterococcus_DN1.PRE.6
MGKGARSSDGVPLETKAFWECMDSITKATHPFAGATSVEAYGDNIKAFNPYTATTLWPPLVAIFRIAFALARPFAPVVALAAGALGIVSLQTAFTAAAVLFGTLCVLDYQFRLAVLGIHSYPYFAFMHADANYQRRWLPVPEADGANAGFVPSRLRGGVAAEPVTAAAVTDNSGTSTPTTVTDTDDEQLQQQVLPGDERDAPESPKAPAAPTEAVALDFAVPEEGHDPTKPLYIVLHGLNGGSAQCTHHKCANTTLLALPGITCATAALAKGSTVCVMVARGLMSTPVVGESLFHGARTSDVEATVAALRSAVGAATPLALVGFSMYVFVLLDYNTLHSMLDVRSVYSGAHCLAAVRYKTERRTQAVSTDCGQHDGLCRGGIIALNYIARAGKQCPLSSCITIAGSFDTRTNMSFWHSRLVWQPLLGLCLKENFVMPHVHKLKARGMEAASLAGLKDVIHFDTHMVAKYHRYEHVMDYYEDMSAGCLGKELQIAVPTLAIHACDVFKAQKSAFCCHSYASEISVLMHSQYAPCSVVVLALSFTDPLMAPELPPTLLGDSSQNANIICLMTKTGGHVGWAQGWMPTKSKWGWSSTAVIQYTEAVLELQQQNKHKSD